MTIVDAGRTISPDEARNIALGVFLNEQHRRWMDDGIVPKLAAAAEFKTMDAAVYAIKLVLDCHSRTVPYDDPCDAIDARSVEEIHLATKASSSAS